MARLAKEYGFSNVTIESFAAGQAWQPTVGELWMTTPKSVKLYDVHDIALSLASLNSNGDATGELVDVGQGRAQDFEGKDVTGKFVLASTGLGGAYAPGRPARRPRRDRRQRDRPAAHVRLSEPDCLDDRERHQRRAPPPGRCRRTPIASCSGCSTRDRWSPSARSRRARRCRRVRRSCTRRFPVTAARRRKSRLAGHLYEGVIKQGANDDNSGCALTLEIGRTYLKLIKEGKLPRPKRTINFQWLAEISGTNAWLNAHPDKAKNLIGDLNFDMEAIRVTQSRSYWVLQRTPDTFPSYLNDIAQSMMEYVADITRERVRFRGGGYAASQPVQSPRGSDDAFYIKIDKHYGSSDHVTYMQHGIPAVMFITWPDMWYHSSEDTPDKQDSTQYKRAAVVGTGVARGACDRHDEMAARVLNDNLGRGPLAHGRVAHEGPRLHGRRHGRSQLAAGVQGERASPSSTRPTVEKGVVASASVLWTNVDDGKKKDCRVRAAHRPARGVAARRGARPRSSCRPRSAACRRPSRHRRPRSARPPISSSSRSPARADEEDAGGGAGAVRRPSDALRSARKRGGGASSPLLAGTSSARRCGWSGSCRRAGCAPAASRRSMTGWRRSWRRRTWRRNAGPSLPTEFNAEFALLLASTRPRSRFGTSCPANSRPCRWPTSWRSCEPGRRQGRLGWCRSRGE